MRINFVSKGIPEGYVESIMKDTNASLETTKAKNTSGLLFDGICAFDITQDGNFFLRPSMLQTFSLTPRKYESESKYMITAE